MMKWWVAAFALVSIGAISTAYFAARGGLTSSIAQENEKIPAPVALAPAERPSQRAAPPVDVDPPARPPRPPSIPPATLPTPRILSLREPSLSQPALTQQPTASADLSPPSGSSAIGKPEAKVRREGTEVVNVPGIVRRQGGRFEFAPADGSAPLVLLENQLLERIAATGARSADPTTAGRWRVTGSVTEYNKTNYLLLRRILQDKP